MMIINLLLSVFLLFLPTSAIAADTRIFYEDFETTSYTDHYLEDQFGTNDSDWWAGFQSFHSQSSSSPYAGSYCNTYDITSGYNSHANTGAGELTYGNLSDFDWEDYQTPTNRYWYFRFRVKWENTSAYDFYHKIWYMGCGGDYYYIAKSGDDSFIVVIRSAYSGNELYSVNGAGPSFTLDDGSWHKVEIFIDFGTTGSSDGDTWVAIDDERFVNQTGLAFTSHPTVVSCIEWPGNISGYVSGSQQVWTDEYEAWILDAPLAYDDTEPTAQEASGRKSTAEHVSGGMSVGAQ